MKKKKKAIKNHHFHWPDYLSVEELEARSNNAKKNLGNGGVTAKAKGRAIAASFWGKSWCRNLENYADYDHRLSRGRTYLRHGAVIDLTIAPGLISGRVVGSMIYDVSIRVTPMTSEAWQELCHSLPTNLTSVVDILAGTIPDDMAERLCSYETGIFPTPQELKPNCNCLDWADLCKHGAALLYAFGVHLDEQANDLFALRQVDPMDLLSKIDASADSQSNLLSLFDLGPN